ncbi:MAG: site-specific DNA-methyltransferase [Chloroflexota bacterium]|nr:site-specific DNA-methyltransferase [Chloroflexota bacterium]
MSSVTPPPRTPILEADGTALYRGDALAVLRSLPSASCDACVTDPPYGERVARWDGPRCREWYVAWMREVDRVVVTGGPILTFAPRRRFDVLMSALREVRGDLAEAPLQMIVWVHRQGFRPAPGYLRPEHEAIVVSGLLRVNADDVLAERDGRGPVAPTSRPAEPADGPDALGRTVATTVGTVLAADRTRRRDRTGHPTQKPEDLIRLLVALTTPPGGSVLDPFCGSGTTLVAARATGREAIGVDRSIRACNLAIGRLSGRSDRDRPAEIRPLADASAAPVQSSTGRSGAGRNVEWPSRADGKT